MIEPNVIPVKEAAKQHGCSVQLIYQALADGRLNGLRLAGTRLVIVDDAFEKFQVQEVGGRLQERYLRRQQ